jgi:hypothetical protein
MVGVFCLRGGGGGWATFFNFAMNERTKFFFPFLLR